MSLSKESADAFRQCLRILAPFRGPEERRTMARNAEAYIAKGEWIKVFRLEDIATLFYPNDTVRAEAMKSKMLTAMESGDLQSNITEKKAFFASELAAWPECPPVPNNSPLRFWLPEWMQEKERAASAEPSERAALKKDKNDWPDAALKQLRQEYKEGATQDQLAAKHNCTRQNIGKLLKKADEKFGKPKAGHFDAVTTWRAKK